MSGLTLVEYPNKILEERCEEVNHFDPVLWRVVEQMKRVMLDSGGMGLAANQVGLNARIIVMAPVLANGSLGIPFEMINPEITLYLGDDANLPEACLSAPGIRKVVIGRFEKVKVEFKNKYGDICRKFFTGINAVCVQHEIDHLNGISFIERRSR